MMVQIPVTAQTGIRLTADSMLVSRSDQWTMNMPSVTIPICKISRV